MDNAVSQPEPLLGKTKPQSTGFYLLYKSTDLPTQMKSRKKNLEKVPMKKRYAMCSIQVWSESWLLLEKTQHLRI